MNPANISLSSKLLLVFAAVALTISIFVPIWRIELDAPQYPEGLVLLIYSNKMGGAVDIINGLNHYIGMQTLHADNFIEFTILPYIIGAYVLMCIITAIIGRKKWLYVLFFMFVAFGVIAMVDFWRWEYNYGHNLDPTAAIIVPGMAYQPPLIGFKQLLNFGAYSIPDKGGWLFLLSGLLMLIAVLMEKKNFSRIRLTKKTPVIFILTPLLFSFVACGTGKADPIKLNTDACDFCKMTIVNGKFGAELITEKGRTYKFDDMGCMLRYKDENTTTKYKLFFVHDYMRENILISVESSYFVASNELKSPMGGNIAAFSTKEQADEFAKHKMSSVKNWNDLQQK